MITPITSVHPVDVRQTAQPPAEVKPDTRAVTPPVPKSGQLSDDQVTLRARASPTETPTAGNEARQPQRGASDFVDFAQGMPCLNEAGRSSNAG